MSLGETVSLHRCALEKGKRCFAGKAVASCTVLSQQVHSVTQVDFAARSRLFETISTAHVKVAQHMANFFKSQKGQIEFCIAFQTMSSVLQLMSSPGYKDIAIWVSLLKSNRTRSRARPLRVRHPTMKSAISKKSSVLRPAHCGKHVQKASPHQIRPVPSPSSTSARPTSLDGSPRICTRLKATISQPSAPAFHLMASPHLPPPPPHSPHLLPSASSGPLFSSRQPWQASLHSEFQSRPVLCQMLRGNIKRAAGQSLPGIPAWWADNWRQASADLADVR